MGSDVAVIPEILPIPDEVINLFFRKNATLMKSQYIQNSELNICQSHFLISFQNFMLLGIYNSPIRIGSCSFNNVLSTQISDSPTIFIILSYIIFSDSSNESTISFPTYSPRCATKIIRTKLQFLFYLLFLLYSLEFKIIFKPLLSKYFVYISLIKFRLRSILFNACIFPAISGSPSL